MVFFSNQNFVLYITIKLRNALHANNVAIPILSIKSYLISPINYNLITILHPPLFLSFLLLQSLASQVLMETSTPPPPAPFNIPVFFQCQVLWIQNTSQAALINYSRKSHFQLLALSSSHYDVKLQYHYRHFFRGLSKITNKKPWKTAIMSLHRFHSFLNCQATWIIIHVQFNTFISSCA